jgi:hypothetical protein
LAVPHIEVGAMAAGYGVSAAAISAIFVVFTVAIAAISITLTVVALACRLILRRKSAIRIAQAVAGAQIPAIAARWRMGISPVLDLLDERFARVRKGSRRAQLKRER